MARKKKTKVTETLLQEVKEAPKKAVKKKKPEPRKPEPQRAKLFNTPVHGGNDSETSSINFGISGVL